MRIPFFGEMISHQGVRPDPSQIQALNDMPPPKTKKELQSFLGIVNYLSKFSLVTAEVWAIKQANFDKSSLDMEQDIPRSVRES